MRSVCAGRACQAAGPQRGRRSVNCTPVAHRPWQRGTAVCRASAAPRASRSATARVEAAAQAPLAAQAQPAPPPAKQQWWQCFFPGRVAAQEEAHEQMRRVNEAELEQLLLAADAGGPPLIVVFSAHWCGPCKLLAQQLAATSAALRAAGAAAEFVTVEAPDAPELSSRLNVHQLPCTFFVGGRGRGAPAMRMEGLLAGAVVEEAVRGKSGALGSDLLRAIKL
ncbi:MAG: hypothetical protein J3K34DRAFT_399749 [Monoraphidium minutum]|nr:MAG: hypothetical protein J3K34DRAFT_399749 [Monoraphidium minutum]